MSLWEILVPTEKRIKSQKPNAYDEAYEDPMVGMSRFMDDLKAWERKNAYTTRYHKVWDAKIRGISGGMTVMTPAKGQWLEKSDESYLFEERMIPVRIVCTRAQIEEIIDHTLVYYDQLAVLCYKLSNEIIMKHRT